MGMRFRPGNLVFREAKTDDELKKLHKVTSEIYRKAMYTTKDEKDAFPDKYSVFSKSFCATKNGRIVGGIRSVEDVIGLPMDEVFDVSSFKEEAKSRGRRYVECGARATYPMRSPKTNLGLLIVFYQYLVKNNISDTLVAMNEPDMSFYENLGFEIIGDKEYYEKVHSWSYPMRLRTEELRQPYRDLFLQAHDNIILD